jgi:hypothetical protein
MASYKVTSDRIAGKKLGEMVTDSDLVDVNIAALVDGGHLEAVRVAKPDKQFTESEK